MDGYVVDTVLPAAFTNVPTAQACTPTQNVVPEIVSRHRIVDNLKIFKQIWMCVQKIQTTFLNLSKFRVINKALGFWTCCSLNQLFSRDIYRSTEQCKRLELTNLFPKSSFYHQSWLVLINEPPLLTIWFRYHMSVTTGKWLELMGLAEFEEIVLRYLFGSKPLWRIFRLDYAIIA